jgi:hypothetical protein
MAKSVAAFKQPFYFKLFLSLAGADGIQIAKSVYSGFTDTVGGNSIPAPTVA